LAILALGKLGGRETSPGSDLDLIIVFDAPADSAGSDGERPLSVSAYYTKLVQRIIGALTALTPQGRLFEVDTRLRPSGKAGPLATSLAAFTKYQWEDAWTWEHMALTRARVIAGPRALNWTVRREIRSVLAAPRDPQALAADIRDMRGKIAGTHRGDSPWDVKYRPGGLVDIEFAAQYLQLRHAAALPDILSPTTAIALNNLQRNGFLDEADGQVLVDALRTWQRVQAYLRLTRFPVTATTVPTGALAGGLRRSALPHLPRDADGRAILASLDQTAADALAAVRRIFDGDWPETPGPAPVA
jgi:glutamate-ammonia-ligase adenylyltransferase